MTPSAALRRLVEANRHAQIRPTLTEAPCLWCGYNGPGYWVAKSHAARCPWYEIGGMQERMDALPRVVAAQAALGAGEPITPVLFSPHGTNEECVTAERRARQFGFAGFCTAHEPHESRRYAACWVCSREEEMKAAAGWMAQAEREGGLVRALAQENADLRARLHAVEAEREAQGTKIADLRATVDMLNRHTDNLDDMLQLTERTLFERTAERDALAAALARYGRHLPTCEPRLRGNDANTINLVHTSDPHIRCTCGFDDAATGG